MVDMLTGEVTETTFAESVESMTDKERWDSLSKMRQLRKTLAERIATLESAWIRDMHNMSASVKVIDGRGVVSVDRGTPVYNEKEIKKLYSLLGEDICDAGNRKLISTRITEQTKIDGVRVRQLLKHGDTVKKIVDDAQSNAVQRPLRLKLEEGDGSGYGKQ